MGIVIAGLFVIIGICIIVNIVAIAYFLAFVLRYLDYNTNAPDFMNVDNVFGWIVIIVGFMIAVAVIGTITRIMIWILEIPGRFILDAAFEGEENSIPLMVLGGTLLFTALLSVVAAVFYVAYQFVGYAALNPELSEFYSSGGWWPYVFAYLVSANIFLPHAANRK